MKTTKQTPLAALTEGDIKQKKIVTVTGLNKDGNAMIVPRPLAQLAKTAFTTNEVKKFNDRTFKKERAALLAEMDALELVEFTIRSKDFSGVLVPVKIAVEEPDATYVDVKKLRKIVGDDKFMELVSATQESVKKAVGEAVLEKCLATTKGKRNVTIGA